MKKVLTQRIEIDMPDYPTDHSGTATFLDHPEQLSLKLDIFGTPYFEEANEDIGCIADHMTFVRVLLRLDEL